MEWTNAIKNHLHSNNGICSAVVGEFYICAHKNGVKKKWREELRKENTWLLGDKQCFQNERRNKKTKRNSPISYLKLCILQPKNWLRDGMGVGYAKDGWKP